MFAGADPNAQDGTGKTPLDVCITSAPGARQAALTVWHLLVHGARVGVETLRLASRQPEAKGMALLAVMLRATQRRLPREGLERASRDVQDDALPYTDRAMAMTALRFEEDMSTSQCKALMDGTDLWAAAQGAALRVAAVEAAWQFQSIAGAAKSAVEEYKAALAAARSHTQHGEARRGMLMRAWMARRGAEDAWAAAAVAIEVMVATAAAAAALPPCVQEAIAWEQAWCTHIRALVAAAPAEVHTQLRDADPIEELLAED
jgi:hypothetical protein